MNSSLQPDVGDIGYPQLIQPRQRHLSGQVRVDVVSVVGVGGHHELPFPEAEQVVFPHDAANPLGVDLPALPPQLGSEARPSVGGPFQGDAMDGVAQFHIAIPASRPYPRRTGRNRTG